MIGSRFLKWKYSCFALCVKNEIEQNLELRIKYQSINSHFESLLPKPVPSLIPHPVEDLAVVIAGPGGERGGGEKRPHCDYFSITVQETSLGNSPSRCAPSSDGQGVMSFRSHH